MTRLQCIKCKRSHKGVRLVEHGTDDMPLCKSCFRTIRSGLADYKFVEKRE